MRFLLIIFLGLLAACVASSPEGTRWHASAAQARADSAARAHWHAPAAPLPTRKVRGNYTVIYQVAGPGAVVTGSADNNEKAGQRQGSQASGPGSTAGNESKRTAGGTPWYVWVGVFLVGAGLGDYLGTKSVALLKWLPWRARVG